MVVRIWFAARSSDIFYRVINFFKEAPLLKYCFKPSVALYKNKHNRNRTFRMGIEYLSQGCSKVEFTPGMWRLFFLFGGWLLAASPIGRLSLWSRMALPPVEALLLH